MAGTPDGLVAVEDAGPVLQAVVRLPGCTAAQALSAFTDPVLVTTWWRGELSTDLAAGGRYLVRFPGLGRTMTGQVVGYQPGASLEFSWSWDEVPEPGRTVAVTAADGAPATLTLVHGRYGDGEAELAARAEHRAGWGVLPAAAGRRAARPLTGAGP
jgi:uncharacterized protein YndB with AHSA1/START domain